MQFEHARICRTKTSAAEKYWTVAGGGTSLPLDGPCAPWSAMRGSSQLISNLTDKRQRLRNLSNSSCTSIVTADFTTRTRNQNHAALQPCSCSPAPRQCTTIIFRGMNRCTGSHRVFRGARIELFSGCTPGMNAWSSLQLQASHKRDDDHVVVPSLKYVGSSLETWELAVVLE